MKAAATVKASAKIGIFPLFTNHKSNANGAVMSLFIATRTRAVTLALLFPFASFQQAARIQKHNPVVSTSPLEEEAMTNDAGIPARAAMVHRKAGIRRMAEK